MLFDACSLEANEFDFEDQGGVGRDDTWDTTSTIGIGCRAGKSCLLALLELSDTLIPTLDDLTLTNNELEGLTSVVAGIELLAVGKGTSVVDSYGSACVADGPGTLVVFFNFEFAHFFFEFEYIYYKS